jgi:hypothetical protein
MIFAEYFWRLATRVFNRVIDREKSDIWKFFKAIGQAYDEVRAKIYSIREKALVATAKGPALDLCGEDRKLPRYAGETDDDYRWRLMSAYDIYREGGSEDGMMRLLTALGYTEIEIYPLYKEKYVADPNPEYLGLWAEFIIRLSASERALFFQHYKILKQVINDAKPGESKLHAIVFPLIWDELDAQDWTWNQLDKLELTWNNFEI